MVREQREKLHALVMGGRAGAREARRRVGMGEADAVLRVALGTCAGAADLASRTLTMTRVFASLLSVRRAMFIAIAGFPRSEPGRNARVLG